MQVLKLGLTGSETTLPTASRSFEGVENSLVSTEGRAADGTLHVDFTANKQGFSITYGVVSEATKNIITGIYKLQITNGVFLSFIYTNQAGEETTVTVKMNAPAYGVLIQRGTFYYNGVTINLEQV